MASSGSNDLHVPDRYRAARFHRSINRTTEIHPTDLEFMGPATSAPRQPATLLFLVLAAFVLSVSHAFAHNITPGDAGYIQEIWGVNLIPFTYLGAKHMVTGYDHILFLFGVVFFLYRMKDIAIYVSLFAIGHSITMLAGVWYGWGVNAYVIDAIIGLSVVYKALDNLGAYQRWFGVPAQHQSGDADLRLVPRNRPRNQDPRL